MSGIIALISSAATYGAESSSGSAGPSQTWEAALVESLLQSMAFRGPDKQNSVACDSAWLGHALLRTDNFQIEVPQPCSLDGVTWITTDARIDGRDELIHALHSSTGLRPGELGNSSDAQLILHAYHAWGQGCVEHLMGDFAFALWDGRQRSLLCARDHFGIKPLYYAKHGGGFVAGNTLQTLLQLPEISGELNETAIGDFLLFGFNQSCETTFFESIQRLPAAHALWWQAGELRIWRYFNLYDAVPDSPFRRSEECIEKFSLRFQQAVRDRLRDGRASLLMSGGLDSTSVAATAVSAFAGTNQCADLKAFTATYWEACGDFEAEFATLAANALHIPQRILSGDGYPLFARAQERASTRPEPVDESLGAFDDDFHRAAAAHTRVALDGEGGDIGFHPQAGPYLLSLLKRLQLTRAASGICSSLWHCKRPPKLLLGLRRKAPNRDSSEMPKWLNPTFVTRNGLAERLHEFSRPAFPPAANLSGRPAAHAALEGNFWTSLFESADPGPTGILMETRHPFFDVRLLSWLLALPPIPWSVDKYLLRQAMRGHLPDPVRLRPKAPLAVNPVVASARRNGVSNFNQLAFTEEVMQYVSPEEFFPIDTGGDEDTMFRKFRAISLQFWLQSSGHLKYKKALGGI